MWSDMFFWLFLRLFASCNDVFVSYPSKCIYGSHTQRILSPPPCLGVKAGGDRQELHEAIRVHSMDAGKVVKGEGESNDLLERIAKDPLFKAVHSKLESLVDPKLFIGRAKEQTEEFLEEEINPVLLKEEDLLGKEVIDGVNV